MADNANITVDYNELLNQGTEMKKEAENMETALKNIATAITELNSSWKSNSSEEMYTYIKKIRDNTIPLYRTVVDKYAEFLGTASDTYSQVERELTNESKNLEFI